jgi:hypothetical protein
MRGGIHTAATAFFRRSTLDLKNARAFDPDT